MSANQNADIELDDAMLDAVAGGNGQQAAMQDQAAQNNAAAQNVSGMAGALTDAQNAARAAQNSGGIG